MITITQFKYGTIAICANGTNLENNESQEELRVSSETLSIDNY